MNKKPNKNLFNFKNEETKMHKIREEHEQLEFIRDILGNILRNQISHTISLSEFENNALIYVHALKQINTMYGLNYTFIGPISDELNEQIKLFQFWSNASLNSQIKINKFKKIEFKNITAHGSTSGFPFLTLI